MGDFTSTAPAVLDHFATRWPQVLGPDVQVHDGQPLDVAADAVMIGFSGEPGEDVIEYDGIDVENLGNADLETYTITNFATTWAGRQTDPKIVRDAVYGLVATIAADLKADPSLGRLVLSARVVFGRFAQWQSTDGATATLVFGIRVRARVG